MLHGLRNGSGLRKALNRLPRLVATLLLHLPSLDRVGRRLVSAMGKDGSLFRVLATRTAGASTPCFCSHGPLRLGSIAIACAGALPRIGLLQYDFLAQILLVPAVSQPAGREQIWLVTTFSSLFRPSRTSLQPSS